MSTEISHIEMISAFRIALALGAVNGVFLALPIVWHWIETMTWITGVRMGPGMLVLGVLISIAIAAITTAVAVVVLVVVYNLVADSFGGLEVSLSE